MIRVRGLDIALFAVSDVLEDVADIVVAPPLGVDEVLDETDMTGRGALEMETETETWRVIFAESSGLFTSLRILIAPFVLLFALPLFFEEQWTMTMTADESMIAVNRCQMQSFSMIR